MTFPSYVFAHESFVQPTIRSVPVCQTMDDGR
jgi:hypothetical protein